MMRCFNCGNTLPDDSQFCQYCGSDLSKAIYCTSCGVLLGEGMAFCPKCGEQVVPANKESAASSAEESSVLRTEESVAVIKDEGTEPSCDKVQPMYERPPAAVPVEAPYKISEKIDLKKRRYWPIMLILGILAVIAFAVIALTGEEEQTLSPAEAAKNILYLEVYDSSDVCIGSGSGFLINDDITLVTNYHVIDGACRLTATTADGTQVTEINTVLAYDEVADLAILKCADSVGVLPLPLGDSDQVKQGDAVYAIGYPLGIANTLSDGIVGSRYEENGVDILQITAPISGGSSGGALLDTDSKVIGVICAYYIDGQNMNIAIASNEVAELLEKKTTTTSLEQLYLSTHPQIEFDEYYACVRTISVSTEELADQIYYEWLIGEATEESMVEIMDEYGSEQGGGQLYTIEPGQFVEEIDVWCFDRSRQPGDVAIIKNPYGYSICYFVEAVESRQEDTPITPPASDLTSDPKDVLPEEIVPPTEAPNSNKKDEPTQKPPEEPSSGLTAQPQENAFAFLCDWISNNYNETLKRNGAEDKVYQEIQNREDVQTRQQLVYCEDVGQIYLRYIVNYNIGSSFNFSLCLTPDSTSFSTTFFYYKSPAADDIAFQGYGTVYAPTFSENNPYTFSSFDGDASLMEDCQASGNLMCLSLLDFLNYVFSAYAAPEGTQYSIADFGFTI